MIHLTLLGFIMVEGHLVLKKCSVCLCVKRKADFFIYRRKWVCAVCYNNFIKNKGRGLNV